MSKGRWVACGKHGETLSAGGNALLFVTLCLFVLAACGQSADRSTPGAAGMSSSGGTATGGAFNGAGTGNTPSGAGTGGALGGAGAGGALNEAGTGDAAASGSGGTAAAGAAKGAGGTATTGGSAGAFSGGGDGPAAGGAEAGGAAATLVLDPDTFVFFFYPNPNGCTDLQPACSAYGVVGFAPEAGLCVRMRWVFVGGTCAPVSSVNIVPSLASECTEDPRGVLSRVIDANVKVERSEGCFHWYDNLVDAQVEVSGDPFTGRIVVDNRSTKAPGSTSIGLLITTPSAGRLGVQSNTNLANEPWIQASRAGQPVNFYETFGVPGCNDKPPYSKDVVSGFEDRDGVAAHFTIWDGNIWVDHAGGCPTPEAAPPGQYSADLCFGDYAPDDAGGGHILNPMCTHVDFTLPTKQIIARTTLP